MAVYICKTFGTETWNDVARKQWKKFVFTRFDKYTNVDGRTDGGQTQHDGIGQRSVARQKPSNTAFSSPCWRCHHLQIYTSHGHGMGSSMGWDLQIYTSHGHGMGSSMGWVRNFRLWNGLGWVGYSCQKSIIFFTAIIIPLRKSLTVIYHHSVHHECFPQLPLGVAFYLLIGFWFM